MLETSTKLSNEIVSHQLRGALAAEGRSDDSISTMGQVERHLPKNEGDTQVGSSESVS